MKAKLLILIPLTTLFISFSCKKDDGLPKATQTGAYMMAAKIDGKVWKHTGCIGGCIGLTVNYDDRNFFGISGNDNAGIRVSLIISSLKSTGTYQLRLKGNGNHFAELFNSNANNTKYVTSSSNTGTVTITKLDLAKKIISGSFEFNAESENNPTNIVKVTYGRFDVTYQ